MSYTAVVIEALPIILFLVFFNKTKKEKALSIIPIYSLLFLISNIIDLSFAMKGYRRLFYGFITLFEFLLFSYFIYLNIKKKKVKKLITVLSLSFVTFLIAYTFNSPFIRIDSIPIGIETILVLIFSFLYLFEQMNNPKVVFIYNQYQFWVIVGFMVYLSGSFFIYIFTNQIPREDVVKYWFIIDIFLIVKNMFFTIAILLYSLGSNNKTPRTLSSLKATH